MLPEGVATFITSQGWGQLSGSQAAPGSGIADGRILRTTSGPALYLKLNPSAPPDQFQREAEGLAALAAVAGAPRLPAVFLAGEQFLLLEYLSAARPAPGCWTEFGQQLARVHARTQDRFGFEHDNYIGATPQPNSWNADGYAFFAEQRLLFQAARAERAGRLSSTGRKHTEQLAARLPDLIPAQPASLIHGDLWSGNMIPGPAGQVCLIDPAAHYGWAEADLAMMALFGQPPPAFYSAYTAERPLAPGYRERFEIYNLYHLLNHLNLFGHSYLASVEAVLERYG